MHRNDARSKTIEILTTRGVMLGFKRGVPLEVDRALGVYVRLVEEEKVLAPGPAVTWPDGRPGGAHVLDVDLVRSRVRGNDARTLTLVALTSRGAGDVEDDRFEVDEALAIYELLVEEEGVLVPAVGTYYPHQWPAEPLDGEREATG
jgi:hypothetical protein